MDTGNSDTVDYENSEFVVIHDPKVHEISRYNPTYDTKDPPISVVHQEQYDSVPNESQPKTVSTISVLPKYQNTPNTDVTISSPQGLTSTTELNALPPGVNLQNEINQSSKRPLPEVTRYESYRPRPESGVYQELRETRIPKFSRFLAVVVLVLVIAVICLIIGLAVVGSRQRQTPTAGKAPVPLTNNYEDCQDAMARGSGHNGEYTVTIGNAKTRVYCDLTTDGGGWLVFQRRVDGSVDFYRNWLEYKRGFGDLSGNFWLGNENLHLLTTSKDYTLRIDLMDWEANRRYAIYRTFVVTSSEEKYAVTVGDYSGTAGDSLSGHGGSMFSTKDKDNDIAPWGNCAVTMNGAWWYSRCLDSNLNGPYRQANVTEGNGIVWKSWRGLQYSLSYSEMKIRPRNT